MSDTCPMCGAGPLDHAPGRRWFECGTVITSHGTVIEFDNCLRRQVEALRRELRDAEGALGNMRQQYEALRKAVVAVAFGLGKAAELARKASAAGSYNEGRVHGLEEAEDAVRWVLEQHKLNKRRLVAVEGRLQSRSYQAQDGSTRWITEIVGENVRFLDWPKDGQTGGDGGAGADPFEDGSDGDLPF